jgi:ubiquinone/menaquinone biosynthesis C-methylase UbiE
MASPLHRAYDATWGRLFAAIYDRSLRASEEAGLRERRRELVSRAEGTTLELGAGTGANLEHYTEAVSELILTEPFEPMARRLRERVASSGRAAEVVTAPAEELPVADASVDTVVVTLALCTVDDPEAVLAEVARVLRPGGRLLFLEHVRSEDPRLARRQDRLERPWRFVAHGCRPNRATVATIAASGFEVEQLEHHRIPKAAKIVKPAVTGVARRAAAFAIVAVIALATLSPGRSGASVAEPALAAAQQGKPEFRGGVERIDRHLRRRMTGKSWHEGCPVGLAELRVVRASYVNFDGRVRGGTLVVHERYARGMLRVLKRLYAKRFPIRRMELIDRYDGDDHRSMAHDNTSAFNCRFVAGTSRWSNHAYGKAIDLNPRENPYVSGGHVSPPEGREYADRSRRRKGMVFKHDTVTNSFERILGWRWGGLWPNPTDYQHFSADGT